MTRGVQFVRLLASVVISLAACCFVVAYNDFSSMRMRFDHPDAEAGGIPFIVFVTTHGTYTYAVPVVALFIGVLIIWRWPNSHILIESFLSALWVLALVWAGLILLGWQIQNIPIFHGMRAHYYF